ncbi:MAG TPA: phospholipase A [Flavobacterium sp.]|nr:phospholipase A [Flavobacterium sp.]
MKLTTRCCVFILLISAASYAQTDKFFGNKTRLRNMTERWELDTTATRGTFLITPYKPIYILPFRYSGDPNETPYSGNKQPEYITQPGTNFNNVEAKFQFSFKTKLFQGILWNRVDLWAAYTQISHWQLYNEGLSRPFREINYEPEIILNIPLNFKVFGFRARMAGVAFNHQSNGKSLPFSRSWNRIIFHAGFERKDWSVYIRPWLRLRDSKDDNPDIARYIGRGDLNVIYTHNGSVFSLIGSHNLELKTKVRGNLTFSWSYPISGNLKGYLQASHGYGETLIDYNYKQTTVGIGVSLVEWL